MIVHFRSLSSALCLVAGGILGLSGCGDSAPDETSDNDESVAIAAHEVGHRDLARPLAVNAMVGAREHVRVHARTTGQIEQLPVETGDRVSAGDTLAQLDMTEAQAELQRARALYDEAQLNFERAEELYQRDSISRAEFQREQSAHAVAESELALWQARVDFGRVSAPLDAMVTERYVEPGEHVQTQDSLFALADMTTLVAQFPVSERDVAYLEPGQSLPISVDAFPGMTLTGEIRRVFPRAHPDSRRVPVEVALPDEAFEQGVRPGYLVRLETTIDRREDVLAVPTLAVGTEGTGDDGPFVYRVRDDRLERQAVEIGIVRDQWSEITSGLEAGDVILATNPRDRREDEAVRIVEWRE